MNGLGFWSNSSGDTWSGEWQNNKKVYGVFSAAHGNKEIRTFDDEGNEIDSARITGMEVWMHVMHMPLDTRNRIQYIHGIGWASMVSSAQTTTTAISY